MGAICRASSSSQTLEDGTRISVPEGIALDSLKEGTEIAVSYEERDGKNEATNIQMK